MIANYTETGWQVVTQRAHGILAAQFAFHWKKSDRPDRWVETILAIAEHDDAEVELGGENLLTATGGPLNFDMKEFDLEHCENLALLTICKNRYIALLTSLHMEFLYRKDAAKNIRAKSFLKKQISFRNKLMKELNIKEKEVLRIYNLVEWCDACSLILCQNLVQSEKRSLEISMGPDAKEYSMLQIGDKKISIKPWPFEIDKFEVSFEWRMIKRIQFKSSTEFREEFLKANVNETVWEVSNEAIRKKKRKV
ncbi:MAG: DUF3891 family protein [Ferruginibacter sp.]